MQSPFRQTLRLSVGWASAALGVALPSPILYWVLVQTGAHPDRGEWLTLGMNHGPWRWEPSGLVLCFSYLSLAFIAPAVLAHGFAKAARTSAASAFLPPLAAACFAGMLLHLELTHLFWLVD